MTHATATDSVRLYVEDVGAGTPIVFVHEFGGNYRSWAPQMRYFSRRNRCVVFAARGYPPSDVPESVEAYSQAQAVADILAVMDHCKLDKAHIVGLSMGGFAAVHLGLNHPDRALSLTVAGAGYGAEKQLESYFREVSLQVAKNFEDQGSAKFAEVYGSAAARVQFQNKDPQGWRDFIDYLAQHSARGAANTMRGVQARRPSLYDLEDRLRKMMVPTLVIVGDEDEHCLQPGIFMKRVIPASGLLILPKTGHTINLEEPDAFNRALVDFFAMVEAGRWTPRDPRAIPQEIMKVS